MTGISTPLRQPLTPTRTSPYYTSSVLDYMRSSTDSVTTLKRITTFPNQKPWMNREVRALLKGRDIAFRSWDRRAYSSSRANLKRGITEAKHNHKLRIEEHFTNYSDPRRMWQGIQAITDYKPAHITPQSSDASLPEELNLFYGRFDKDNSVQQPLTLSPADVFAALSRINPRKAAGPDGVPGRVYRACAEQLTEVWTDIFNLSLAQATVNNLSALNPPPSCQCPNTPLQLILMTSAQSHLPPSSQSTLRGWSRVKSKPVYHPHWTPFNLPTARIGVQRMPFPQHYTLPSPTWTKATHTLLLHTILDFLTNRPQSVRINGHTSSTLTLNTGVPQGCVLSPLLYCTTIAH